MKFVVGIIHLIDAECGFKATLIKCFVVSHQRQLFDEWLDLLPHFGKYWSIIGVGDTESVHSATPIIVIFRLRLDERVEILINKPSKNYNHYHVAHR